MRKYLLSTTLVAVALLAGCSGKSDAGHRDDSTTSISATSSVTGSTQVSASSSTYGPRPKASSGPWSAAEREAALAYVDGIGKGDGTETPLTAGPVAAADSPAQAMVAFSAARAEPFHKTSPLGANSARPGPNDSVAMCPDQQPSNCVTWDHFVFDTLNGRTLVYDADLAGKPIEQYLHATSAHGTANVPGGQVTVTLKFVYETTSTHLWVVGELANHGRADLAGNWAGTTYQPSGGTAIRADDYAGPSTIKAGETVPFTASFNGQRPGGTLVVNGTVGGSPVAVRVPAR